MTTEEIDSMIGDKLFLLQLDFGPASALAIKSDRIPGPGTLLATNDGRNVRVGRQLGVRGREAFLAAEFVSDADLQRREPAVATFDNTLIFNNSEHTQPAKAVYCKYLVAHRDSRARGERPKLAWTIYAMVSEWTGLVASDPENASPALRALCDQLNAMDATTTWTDTEATGVHLFEFTPDQAVGDCTGAEFMSRAIELRRHAGGGICGDAWAAKETPNLKGVLDGILPARQLLPAQQAELDRKAAAQAEAERVAAGQAAADEAEYQLATAAFLDSQNDALPARLRAANLAECVLSFQRNPRLFEIANAEAAFHDATGKEASTHARDYEQQNGEVAV